MSLSLKFDNSYARLPDRFYSRQNATPVARPTLLAVNDPLARELGIDPDTLRTPEGLQMLAGNALPENAAPLAQAYAGHQFGGWVPQLGDGRALLLGELLDTNNQRRDIQLKGSGPTPFSRMGDGRAWLGPVLREYLVSEAMHAMGIRTTRALAAVATGETVYRETPLPGAVLTRVASSHIRVGTFQYFAARKDTEALRLLMEHVIARHYPDVNGPLELLEAVVARQAELIAKWLGVGFIHGVMNTDNSHVAGETIDYGPCAFMDTYRANQVFSSVDTFGRYAYDQQPEIGVWNMAQFATCLLPLIDEDRDRAVEEATPRVHAFGPLFRAAWLSVFSAKLGLVGREDEDELLIEDLLSAMEAGHADFTNCFADLATGTAKDAFADPTGFEEWSQRYQQRLAHQNGVADTQAMKAANPVVIPRNHRIEAIIRSAVDGDLDPFHQALAVFTDPYAPDAPQEYRSPPGSGEAVTRTFCGT